MTSRANVAIAVLVGLVAAGWVVAGWGVAVSAQGNRDRVSFPKNYAEGVLYWVQDRPRGNQVREYYASQDAIDAAQKDAPLPNGTVITVVQYNAQLDANGNPSTDANGRFMKGDIRGYTAMEKRAGWGAAYPEDIRNGDWEYGAYSAKMMANAEANLAACFKCHKGQENMDFVFSYENMKMASR